MGEGGRLHVPKIHAWHPVGHHAGQERQGLYRREDGPARDPVIPQIRREGDGYGKDRVGAYRGKVFHRWTVFGSIAAGVPEAFRAQCFVKPRQINAPVSPWVMR